MPDLDYSESYMLNGDSLKGRFLANFKDGNVDALKSNYGLGQVNAALKDGVASNVEGVYTDGIQLKNTGVAERAMKVFGYEAEFNPGTLTVTKAVNPPPAPQPTPVAPVTPPEPITPITPVTPVTPTTPEPASTTPTTPGATDAPVSADAASANPVEKPQIDALITSNLAGTASITEGQRPQVSGADRVLGLQSAELPFFNEKSGTVKFYGTYDVSVDPDKVKMEAKSKVLPEPDQPKNQYREWECELVTESGSAKFRLTYNGSTLDIYPADEAAKALLVAGDGTKNVEVESKALFEAFNHMGITLDDLDGVYTHFESLV